MQYPKNLHTNFNCIKTILSGPSDYWDILPSTQPTFSKFPGPTWACLWYTLPGFPKKYRADIHFPFHVQTHSMASVLRLMTASLLGILLLNNNTFQTWNTCVIIASTSKYIWTVELNSTWGWLFAKVVG